MLWLLLIFSIDCFHFFYETASINSQIKSEQVFRSNNSYLYDNPFYYLDHKGAAKDRKFITDTSTYYLFLSMISFIVFSSFVSRYLSMIIIISKNDFDILTEADLTPTVHSNYPLLFFTLFALFNINYLFYYLFSIYQEYALNWFFLFFMFYITCTLCFFNNFLKVTAPENEIKKKMRINSWNNSY